MKALRIKLSQSQASYTREETVNNRMTYPLPPFSTVIGALHNACGYEEYHPMKISVQGKYGAMQKEIYVNHALLNRLEDDRGILIWLPNAHMLSTGYVAVGEAINGTGNSFKRNITVRTFDSKLMDEYRRLKDLEEILTADEKSNFKPQEDSWKEEKKKLKEEQKKLDKTTEEWKEFKRKIDEGDNSISELKKTFQTKRWEEYEEPISHFRTLTKGPQMQEVLYDVELVIHVKADEKVLEDILSNKFNLVALGRSEDFVEVLEMKIVDIESSVDHEVKLKNNYTMFVNADLLGGEGYGGATSGGTVYYVSKNYEINNGRREFKRIACLYSSNITIDAESKDIEWDSEGDYIVNFN